MYTTQQDSHGNLIVCKGSALRNGYRIIFSGSYAECLQVKARALDKSISAAWGFSF